MSLFAAAQASTSAAADERPNILWITSEDLSPHLGCYGDEFAQTPNLDRFAKLSVQYNNAFASAPLCTPARSSLITGVFASTQGTHHLRGVVPLSKELECFSSILRENGYYCSNNVKEDYNFPTPPDAWDESSDKAHWRNKKSGQPFFSVFNFMTTHQSRTRYLKDERGKVNQTLKPQERVDPNEVPIPPYYPDTPVVRDNLASFYTQITLMDKQFQEIVDQLHQDGLADNTIVFFYSDHGDGLPRGKRWMLDSGLKVPLLIHFPEKYKHYAPSADGAACEDMVSFVDFAPTVLSLVGLEPPKQMQGQAFLGKHKQPAQEYVFAIRDRVDEVLMCSRSVRDSRYHYVRNFMPHRARMQRGFFSEMTPIRQEIRRLHAEGKLTGHETWLMDESIPNDELYDSHTDPYQLNNLAGDPAFASIQNKLKDKLFEWIVETNDLGFVPEFEMLNQSGKRSPLDAFKNNHDIKGLLALADKVGRGERYRNDFKAALTHKNPSYRYWGAVGLAALGQAAKPASAAAKQSLSDESPPVRYTAAEVMCHLGYAKQAVAVLAKGLDDAHVVNQLHASQILMVVGDDARAALPQMKTTAAKLKDEIDHGWYTRENLEYMIKKFDKTN